MGICPLYGLVNWKAKIVCQGEGIRISHAGMKWSLLFVFLIVATAFGNDMPLFAMSRILAEPTEDTRVMVLKGKGDEEALNVERKEAIELGDVEKAILSESGGVRIDFTKEGEQRLNDFLNESYHKRIAFVLRGELVFAPMINTRQIGRSIVLDGNFSKDFAEKVVAEIEKAKTGQSAR